MTDTKDLDLVVLGATGFAGRRAVAHLMAHAPTELRWAVAGRDREKLERLRSGVPMLVVDVTDAASLGPVLARTRVVLNMAGPFRRLGDQVVAACIEHKVHYCDISGETARIRDLVDREQNAATRAGVKVVCFAGVSSAPAELAMLLLEQDLGEPLHEATAVVRMRSKHLNGGTLSSISEGVESGDAQREREPFLLGPRDRQPTQRERDPAGMWWDGVQHGWRTPCPLAVSDTRAIRFSGSLRGTDIQFQEYQAFDGVAGLFPALKMRARFKGLGLALRTRRGRALLTRLNPPGGGPSEQQVNPGSYRLDVTGTGVSGRDSRVTMGFDGDPGGYVTAVCAAEIAVALCVGGDDLPDVAGILTPGTAIGVGLVDRLVAAGMHLTPGREHPHDA